MAISRRYLSVFRFWALGSLFMAAGVIAHAQTPSRTPGNARQFSVYVTDMAEAKTMPVFVLSGEQAIELPVKSNLRSDLRPWPGERPLRLAVRNMNSAAGQAAYTPIAELGWPAPQSNRALIILVYSSGSASPRAFVVDDDVRAFPVNSAFTFNATKVPLMLRFNTFSGDLAAGGLSPMVDYPDMQNLPPSASVRYPFALALRRLGEEPLVLNSGFQEVSPGTRTLLIVTPPAEAGSTRVRVRKLVDRPAEARPAVAAPRS